MTEEQWEQLRPFAEAAEVAAQEWMAKQAVNVAGLASRERLEVAMASEASAKRMCQARDAYREAQKRILGAAYD